MVIRQLHLVMHKILFKYEVIYQDVHWDNNVWTQIFSMNNCNFENLDRSWWSKSLQLHIEYIFDNTRHVSSL